MKYATLNYNKKFTYFTGLSNANDLTLRITNTSLRSLPDGLLKYLADIRYITIDLRNNQLQTVSPAVFFNHQHITKDLPPAKMWQSRQLLGMMIPSVTNNVTNKFSLYSK